MGLSPFQIGATTGDAWRIQPKNWTAPDGDWVFALGSDTPGVFVRVNSLDFIRITQLGDFDVTKVFRFRAFLRGPTRYPAVFSVGASTDTYGFDLTLAGGTPVSISYVADTNGLPISGQTGSTASITAFSPTTNLATVGSLTGMTADSVGRNLEISGAATPGNNGKFPIREFVDANTVKVENAAAVAPDGNNGSISWTERRRDDDFVTIARALVAAINADPIAITAKHLLNGVFQAQADDSDDEFTITNGLPNTTFMKFAENPRWIARMTIDGATRWTANIDPRRSRDLFDGGSQVVYLAPGSYKIGFQLEMNFAAALLPTGGPYEVELPGVYFDALVFDEVT